jgi:hypothetical protein
MELNGQLHAPAYLPPGKVPPARDWVGPRVGLDVLEKEESCTAGNQTRAVQPVTILTAIKHPFILVLFYFTFTFL